MKKTAYTLSILACVLLSACSSTQTSAPISDLSGMTNPRQKQMIDADTVNYTVEPGDTLSQIARRSNHSVSELIAWNNISTPDTIEVGQVLRVQRPENTEVTMAPVADQGTASSASVSKPVAEPKPLIGKATTFYTVEPGDTLSGIARRSGHSVADLVAWNNLGSADSIEVGQKLRVQHPDAAVKTVSAVSAAKTAPAKPAAATASSTHKTASAASSTTPAATHKTAETTKTTAGNVSSVQGVSWSWPTHGKVISSYTAARRGIDISGTKGQKVVAAADGTVLHKGAMNGYGNLLIIKHNNNVLSAYAHNDRILVKEGQKVSRGQQIAEMGNSDSERVKLHFEIRYQGKPVDPTKYLPHQ